MTITEEYISNGNGHSNGNGLSPSQKAWQTAKDRAVAEVERRQAENRARFELQQQELTRATMDKDLSHGAARLFQLLTIACWKKELGGVYNGRVGSVLIDGRRLARYCGGASVNQFYHKTRKEKRDPKTGAVLRSASETTGWIEQLVRGGYIWISKHRIPNIPAAKWPNVYNVTCHVAERYTPNLPWVDGNFGSESVVVEDCSRMENSVFAASEQPGDTQTLENATGNQPHGTQPISRTAHSPLVQTRTAHQPHGTQPVGSNENRQAPERPTGKHRNGQQASTGTANGQTVNPVHLRESIDPVKTGSQETSLHAGTRLGNRAGADEGLPDKKPQRPTSEEKEFLEHCQQVFGEPEMQRNGGLWRKIYREDKQKAWKVIHETRGAQKEPDRARELKKTWAAYAMHLWKNGF